jgi:hypothetical protein
MVDGPLFRMVNVTALPPSGSWQGLLWELPQSGEAVTESVEGG